MKLKLIKNSSKRLKVRMRNKMRIRKKIQGSDTCPRLVVFRSLKHIYAQLVDDIEAKVLAQVSTLKLPKVGAQAGSSAKSSADSKADTKPDTPQEGRKVSLAYRVGQELALKAQKLSLQKVVFDRAGYAYHGRVRAVAEGARAKGLKF